VVRDFQLARDRDFLSAKVAQAAGRDARARNLEPLRLDEPHQAAAAQVLRNAAVAERVTLRGESAVPEAPWAEPVGPMVHPEPEKAALAKQAAAELEVAGLLPAPKGPMQVLQASRLRELVVVVERAEGPRQPVLESLQQEVVPPEQPPEALAEREQRVVLRPAPQGRQRAVAEARQRREPTLLDVCARLWQPPLSLPFPPGQPFRRQLLPRLAQADCGALSPRHRRGWSSSEFSFRIRRSPAKGR
jgi:hypothetical protein